VDFLSRAGQPLHKGEWVANNRRSVEDSVITLQEAAMEKTIADLDDQQLKSTADTPTAKKKDKCFIATAAHGSALAPDVVMLQHFRDTRLKKSALGRRIVSLYERYSPPMADAIAQHPVVRLWVRWWVLSPLVWFVRRWTA
jgi:hypothetical protein